MLGYNSTFEQNPPVLRRKKLFVYGNADKMHEKELCSFCVSCEGFSIHT